MTSNLFKSLFLNKIILIFALYFLQIPINVETDFFNLILLIGVLLLDILRLIKYENKIDKFNSFFQESFLYHEVFGYIGLLILLLFFIQNYSDPIILASKLGIYLLIMSKYMLFERVQSN